MATLSFYADLLWTAKEIFSYPRQELIENGMSEIRNLIHWCTLNSAEPVDDAAIFENHSIDLEQLQVDFTGLFINGFPAAKAHPYAGWYLGETIVFGPSDEKMKDFYSRYGLEYDHTDRIPADHITIELEFLAFMVEKYEETGSEIYFAGLQEMMNEHLEPWVFRFLQDMEVQARTDYYRYLARALTILLTQLKNQLKEVA